MATNKEVRHRVTGENPTLKSEMPADQREGSRGRGLRVAAVALLSAFLAASCATTEEEPREYDESYRPQYHFTPPQNWMNDPNGLVYHEGEYHLFYQHNPSGNDWGNLSWGYAVSSDFVHWEHLPVAIEETDELHIYSGSAVFDADNTSGLGTADTPPLVAIYTGHHKMRSIQDQRIAYSLDNGRTWEHYEGNPVVDDLRSNFRDPKVFWHEDTDRWIMAVALPTFHRIQFYSSPNLLDWELESEFGPAGSTDGHWECPDLFRLPVEGSNGESRWVLQVDINDGAIAGGSGAQYFVGTFDGSTFRKDPETEGEVHWVDYGPDFYASQSYSGMPDDRHVRLAWMSNWNYARNKPTDPWRGAMTVPRQVRLIQTAEGPKLAQQPVEELKSLRGEGVHLKDVSISDSDSAYTDDALEGISYELVVKVEPQDAHTFGLRLRKGEEEQTVIGYDVAEEELYVDRTQSGRSDFDPDFPGPVQRVPLPLHDGGITLRILVDRSSVEVFADRGQVAMTNRIFPDHSSDGIELFAEGGTVRLKEFDFWPLTSVW